MATISDWVRGKLALALCSQSAADDIANCIEAKEDISTDPTFRSLVFDSRSDADLDSSQGVAFDGLNYYSVGGASNDEITKWSKSGDTYTATVGPITVSGSWPAIQEQINSLQYHDPGDGGGPRLWVGGNNYKAVPTDPDQGFVQEYNPNTLAFIRSHDTEPAWSEGGSWRPGFNEFWVCYDNKLNDDWMVSRYTYRNNQLIHMANLSLTDEAFESGTHYHNHLLWIDSTTFLMTIHEGTKSLGIRVYEYDATSNSLTLIQRIKPPTKQCTQGMATDTLTDHIYFAERFYPDGVSADHRILSARLVSAKAKSGVPHLNTSSLQATGLVAWYPLAEGSGTIAHEIVNGSSHNGTYVNGSWVTDNALGSCFELDGSTAYVDLSPDIFAAGLTEAMVMFWVNPISGNALVSGDASGANPGDWQVKLDTTGARGLDFYYTAATAKTDGATGLNGELDYLSWSHVCVALDGGGGEVYINGVSQGTNVATGTMGGSAQGLRVGAGLTGAEHLRGIIRDVRIYNAKSEAVINASLNPATMFDLWA